MHFPTYIIFFSDVNSYYFIGGSDVYSDGDWHWITGETWDYENFAGDQPNGGIFEGCLMLHYPSMKWHDIGCIWTDHNYICE